MQEVINARHTTRVDHKVTFDLIDKENNEFNHYGIIMDDSTLAHFRVAPGARVPVLEYDFKTDTFKLIK